MAGVTLDAEQVVDTARRVLKIRESEQNRLRKIAAYMRGKHSSVYTPRGAQAEYRWIRDRSTVNMLPLVVSVIAQNLYVDGYRPAKSDDNASPWATWQANRMDARQHGLHRSVLTYGAAYNVVLPGTPRPVIRPVSPRRMTALYADPVDDEWPLLAIEETIENTTAGRRRIVRLYDNKSRYQLVGTPNKQDLELDPTTPVMAHDLGVCPVVRYCNEVDLDGEMDVCGEVEPLIDVQDQINFTTFGLLMAQQYAAFRQRWVTGMAPPLDANGQPYEPFRAGVDRLFVGDDPKMEFGEFGQTDLGGHLDSRESSIRHMSTISQVPPYHLLGQIANLSAEALAAARDGLDRKSDEKESTLGESHEQTLRLAGLAAGDKAAWEDTSAQVVWRDTSARSLAATVDALGKLATMLGVPMQELWERIPGVTQTDVERWKATAAEGDALGNLREILDRQAAARTPQTPALPAPPPVPALTSG
jgi:hypothetical protein